MLLSIMTISNTLPRKSIRKKYADFFKKFKGLDKSIKFKIVSNDERIFLVSYGELELPFKICHLNIPKKFISVSDGNEYLGKKICTKIRKNIICMFEGKSDDSLDGIVFEQNKVEVKIKDIVFEFEIDSTELNKSFYETTTLSASVSKSKSKLPNKGICYSFKLKIGPINSKKSLNIKNPIYYKSDLKKDKIQELHPIFCQRMNLGNYIVNICPNDESGIVDNPSMMSLQQPNELFIMTTIKQNSVLSGGDNSIFFQLKKIGIIIDNINFNKGENQLRRELFDCYRDFSKKHIPILWDKSYFEIDSSSDSSSNSSSDSSSDSDSSDDELTKFW